MKKYSSKTTFKRTNKFLNLSFVFPTILSLQVHSAETATVLPKGISRARLVLIRTDEISKTYNEKGDVGYISGALNRSLTTRDYANKNTDLQKLVQILNQIQNGLGEQLLNTNLYTDFKLTQNVLMPTYEYGLSDKLSLGLRIPVVHRKADMQFKASTVNNAQYISANLGEISPQVVAGANAVAGMNLNTESLANMLFASKGYKTPQNFEKTELGDIEVGGKYNFINNEMFSTSGQLGLRFPTGSTPELDNPFDKGSGDGSYAFQSSVFQNFSPTQNILLNATGKLSLYMPDTRDRAVPKNESDSLPSLRTEDGQVQSVTRNRGPEYYLETSSTYFFVPSTSAWLAYQKTLKDSDTFTGNGDLYYNGLSKNTSAEKDAAEIALNYSTLPAFRKKKASIPMEVSALYNRTLSGRNIPIVDYGRIDFIMYF